MDFAAPHIAYVFSAYGISTVVILGLLVHVVLRGNSLKRALARAKLNDPGVREDAPGESAP